MTLIAGLVAVATLYLLLQMLRNANPTVLARMGRKAGGVGCLAIAAFTGIRGELAVAIPLGLFGAGLLGWSPGGLERIGLGRVFGGGGSSSGGARSRLVELEPDPRNGRLSGRFIAGPYAGHSLDAFEVPQLVGMKPNLDRGSAVFF